MKTEQSAFDPISEMLVPSSVCEFGEYATCMPFITFCHDKSHIYSRLWIDTEWKISPSPMLPVGLSEDDEELILLSRVRGLNVIKTTLGLGSSLTIHFDNEIILSINDAVQHPEPWKLTEVIYPSEHKQRSVIGLAGSEPAIIGWVDS